MLFINYTVKKGSYLPPIISLVIYISLLLFPSLSSRGVKNGIDICLSSLIPAIFPFCFSTNLLLACNFEASLSRIFGRPFEYILHLSPSLCFPYIIGIFSGYPQGAIAIIDVYQKGVCTKKEAEHALCFCNNTGIGFIMGISVSLLDSKRAGLLLFSTQLLVSLLYAILFRPTNYKNVKPKTNSNDPPDMDIFAKALTKSIYPMATVCGYVIIFGFIAELIKKLFQLTRFPKEILCLTLSVFEITNGIWQASELNLKLPFIAFALSFSGLCVHLQIYSCVKGILSTKKFFFAKLFQGVLAFLIMLFFKIY